MIQNTKTLQDFETELIRKDPLDITANFRIADALYAEAVSLGIFPLNNPLDGLDTIIHLAKVVNSVPGAPH
jgi:hypothetical protein